VNKEIEMKNRALAFLVVLSLTILLSTGREKTSAQAQVPTANPLAFNTVSLNFSTAQIDPNEGNQVIRAFVPTGSKSVNCLATMNEIGADFPLNGIALFCGERQPAAFGNVPGMLVSVFLPQPASPDFVMSVTLWQQGAKSYGAPVLCTGDDGC
jgi:hypothetical protein